MPSFCVVSNCEFKYVHSPNISFHKFPFHTEELLRKWIQFTDRGQLWFPSRWSSICSRHFLPNDFRDHVNRKCLKRSAVPSITIKSVDCSSIRLATHVPDENISMCRLCARTSIGNSSKTRSLDDPVVSAAIYKCFPTIRFDLDDELPQKICSECASQLNRFATYVDQIMSIQAEFQRRHGFVGDVIISNHQQQLIDSNFGTTPATTEGLNISGHFKDLPQSGGGGQKMFKIKQEPLVNVKQEYMESSRTACGEVMLEDHYIPDSDAFCEFCDVYFINNIELKKHILTFHPPGNNNNSNHSDQDQVPNNCEIMEIITLENAFINLAEEDTTTAATGNENEREFDAANHHHEHHQNHQNNNNNNHLVSISSDMIPLEQVLKVEHFNDYEQREHMRVIQNEHCYCRRVPDLTANVGVSQIVANDLCTSSIEQDDQVNTEINKIIEAADNGPPILIKPIVYISRTEDLLEPSTNHNNFIETIHNTALELHKVQPTLKICKPCNITFKNTRKYLVHKQRSHPHTTGSVYQRNLKAFRCLDCTKRFSTKSALYRHRRSICVMQLQQQQSTTNTQPFTANSSNNNINNSLIGISHEEQMSSDKQTSSIGPDEYSIINRRYACSLCDRTYGRKSNLNRHFVLHRPREQWHSKCPHCDSLFEFEHDVTVHLRTQKCPGQQLFILPPPPPQMPTVSTTAATSLTINKSSINNSNIIDCPKSTNTSPLLPQKMTQPLKTYQQKTSTAVVDCDICEQRFESPKILRQHKKSTHLANSRFPCTMCDKVFKRVGGLNQHVNGFHLKIKRYTCATCNYSYALKGDWKRCRHSRLNELNN